MLDQDDGVCCFDRMWKEDDEKEVRIRPKWEGN